MEKIPTLRLYQEKIVGAAIKKNTLVVLPTGLGKTLIGLSLAFIRLKKFQGSKVLFLAPSKPLVHQHYLTSSKYFENVIECTGARKPEERKEDYKKANVIIATPQTIESDILTGRIKLDDVSLIVFDEAHRATGNYSYTFIAQMYEKTGKNILIAGLTASPGGFKEKIDEIRKNLFIEGVEVKTEDDLDVKGYLADKKIEYIEIELPSEFSTIKKLLELVLKKRLSDIKKMGFIDSVQNVNKKDLLVLNSNLVKNISPGDFDVLNAISLSAAALKIMHSIELLETQGISSLFLFFEKLQKQPTKAAKTLFKDPDFNQAYLKTRFLYNNNYEHPKLGELKQLCSTVKGKIIIFSQYRNTVDKIVKTLEPIRKPIGLIGQKEGLTQKKQIEIVKKFENGEFDILVCTSIGEEGLDIKGVDAAIFYECSPSEIRTIQRAGRVARHKPGKIMVLVAKGTRDETYLWSAHWKKKRMNKILDSMKEEPSDPPQKTLADF